MSLGSKQPDEIVDRTGAERLALVIIHEELLVTAGQNRNRLGERGA